MSVFEDIIDLLGQGSIEYKTIHHEKTLTSEDSARVRGESLKIGAKAIVMKVGEKYRIFVLSAVERIDAGKIRSHFRVKKTRFATPVELLTLTGLVPGAVPPFGRPVLDLDLYIDLSIIKNDRVAFNAGSLTDSVIMACTDYLQIARGTVLDFTLSS